VTTTLAPAAAGLSSLLVKAIVSHMSTGALFFSALAWPESPAALSGPHSLKNWREMQLALLWPGWPLLGGRPFQDTLKSPVQSQGTLQLI
jgi:hypothetical protein